MSYQFGGNSRARTYCACSRYGLGGGGGVDIFFVSPTISFFFSSNCQGDGSIYTEILSQRAIKLKTVNQPTKNRQNMLVKCVKWIICFFLAIPSQYCIDWNMYHYILQSHQAPIAQLGLMNLFGLFTGLKSAYLGFNILNFNPFALRMGKLHRVLAVLSDKGLNKNAA